MGKLRHYVPLMLLLIWATLFVHVVKMPTEETTELGMISVTGKGSVLVRADSPILNVTIESTANNAAEASNAAAEKQQKLLDKLQETEDLMQLKIKTTRTSLTTKTEYVTIDVTPKGELTYVSTLSLELSGFDTVEVATEVLNWCTANEAIDKADLTFDRGDISEQYQQALTAATEDAYAKIKSLVGDKKYKIVTINEQSYATYARPYDAATNDMVTAKSSIEVFPGDEEVTASVFVTVKLT